MRRWDQNNYFSIESREQEARGQLVPEGHRVGDAGDAELPAEGLLPARALPGDAPGVATLATGDDPEDPEEVAAGELGIPGDNTGDTAVPGTDNGEVPDAVLGDEVVPAVSGTAPGDVMDGERGSEADGEGGEREVAVGDRLVL